MKDAIRRAENTEINNRSIETTRNMYGFEYYEINPSASIHRVVQYILEQVGLF